MKLLITGISGFIGRNLINKIIKHEKNILGISRNKIKLNELKLLKGDLKDISKIKDDLIKFQPEVVIHLAWQGIPDYSFENSKKNLELSMNFFEFIFDNTKCRKIIISGSCWEYDKREGPCNENMKITNNNSFSWAKNSLYDYLNLKCIELNIDFIWFRIFYVFGPLQKNSSLIPYLYYSLKENSKPIIKKPKNSNDFVYIEDVINIIYIAIKKNIPSGIYNIGSGKSTSVLEIIKLIEKELISKNNYYEKILNEKHSSYEIENFWSDNTKLTKNFSYNFDYSLEQRIIEFIKYIDKKTI